MNGVEPGKQSPDEAGPFPRRQGAIELTNRGRGRLENIEDVFNGRKTGNVGTEASPSLRVQFENTGVQAWSPSSS
jgi:hypothetical protein